MAAPETAETIIYPAPPELDESFEPSDVVEAAEELLRIGAPHDFQILILGGGCAGIAAARRASELGASVGIIDPHLASGGDFDDERRTPLDMVLDAWHDALLAQRTLTSLNALSMSTVEFDRTLSLDGEALWRRAALEADKRRTARRRLLEASGVEIFAGRARFIDEHVVEFDDANGNAKQLRAVHIIIATGAGRAENSFAPSRDSFIQLLKKREDVAVVGRDALALEWAALLSASGAKVTLVRSEDELWCDATVRSARELLEESGVETVVATPKLERDGERVKLRGGKGWKAYSFSGALCTAREVDAASLGLETAGIEWESGRVAVDGRGETGVGGVHAVGACAEKCCDAAWAGAPGTRIAEPILRAEERLDVAHAPRRLRMVPELAATGLSESDAWALGIGARAVDGRWGKNRHLRLVADDEGLLLGCQACGDGAADLVRQASLALRAGWTAARWAQLLPETSAAPWLSALRQAAQSLG